MTSQLEDLQKQLGEAKKRKQEIKSEINALKVEIVKSNKILSNQDINYKEKKAIVDKIVSLFPSLETLGKEKTEVTDNIKKMSNIVR